MLHDETILCLATLSWDYLWQRHQEIMRHFAEAGNRVIFVEPIGIRVPQWQDRGRLLARVGNRLQGGGRGMRQAMPNVWVVDPLINPFQQVQAIHRRNVTALTKQLQKTLAHVGGGTPILWDYVPTPLARDTMANLPRKLLVYDCMDALTENPKGVFATVAETEKEISRQADVVFVSAPTLMERQKGLNPHTYLVENGVNYEQFADATVAEPGALKKIPHPRLIFFGGIDERVDLELLEQLVARHPDWHLILLGAVRTEIGALTKLRNVHYLGQVEHTALPAYLHHADVLLLPYRQMGFSFYMYPAKLNEGLATGKPMVATALPAIRDYADVVAVTETKDAFENAVKAAVAETKDAEKIGRRQARAHGNTWDARFERICEVMEERMRDEG